MANYSAPVGRPITRVEALRIASQIGEDAERERSESVMKEAGVTDYSALSDDDLLDIEVALRLDGYRWVHETRAQEFADGYRGESRYPAHVLRKPLPGDVLVKDGETSEYLETDGIPRYSQSWDEIMRVVRDHDARTRGNASPKRIMRRIDDVSARRGLGMASWLVFYATPRDLCEALLQAREVSE